MKYNPFVNGQRIEPGQPTHRKKHPMKNVRSARYPRYLERR
jgi:hypothetical protein